MQPEKMKKIYPEAALTLLPWFVVFSAGAGWDAAGVGLQPGGVGAAGDHPWGRCWRWGQPPPGQKAMLSKHELSGLVLSRACGG